MQLDQRLKKIASGMNVSQAIESYLETLDSPEPVDPAEEKREELLASIELMFLMAAVDGEIADEEVQELRASVMALEDIEAIEGGIDLGTVMEDLGQKLEKEGWRGRLHAACARIRAPEARSFAFQLAAGVAFVDDFVAHAEAAAIDSLAQALDLPKAESQHLLRDGHASLFGVE